MIYKNLIQEYNQKSYASQQQVASDKSLVKKIFFKIAPILKFEVKEESMVPTLKPGDLVLVERISKPFRDFKTGEIVVFKKGKEWFIKKIQTVHDRRYFVVGENAKFSIDSRHFGWVDKKDIIGKIFRILKNE